MHYAARFLIGYTLLALPVLCAAESTPADTSTGSTTVESDSGSILRERLASLAEGAVALDEFAMPAKVRTAWQTETARFMERRTELRARCHEELRKANRDMIADRAAQCLRSDLLLEIGFRMKQRDMIAKTPGVSIDPTKQIDAWGDAANAVIDGIDAGVFNSLETLKEAKQNLHQTYRRPMLLALTLARVSVTRALIATLAGVAMDTADQLEDPVPFLSAIVPCLEDAHATRVAASSSDTPELAAAGLRSTVAALAGCTNLIEEQSGR